MRAAAQWTIPVAVIALLTGVATLTVSVGDTAALTDRVAQAQLRGSHLVEVRPSAPSAVSAHACHRLSHISGVTHSGGASYRGSVSPRTLPNMSYQWFEATAGFPAIVWRGPPSGNVHLGHSAQRDLGVGPGATVAATLNGSPDTVSFTLSGLDGAADYQARNDGFDSALMTIVPPTGEVEMCFVETAQLLTAETAAAVQAAMYPQEVELIRNAQQQSEYLAAVQSLDSRVSRSLGLGAAALLVAAFLMLTQVRRAEYAIYRSFHARPHQILVMVITEAAAIVLAPLAVGATLALSFGADQIVAANAALVLGDYLWLVIGACVAPLLAWLILLPQNIFTTLKTG